MKARVQDVSILGRDDDGERFTVGPIRCRVDSVWGPAEHLRLKLVNDWLGYWPHMALECRNPESETDG